MYVYLINNNDTSQFICFISDFVNNMERKTKEIFLM